MAQYCPSCRTALVPRGGTMVCRQCTGELKQAGAAPGGAPAKRRGGATFSGQRGRFERPRAGGPGPLAGAQRRLGSAVSTPTGKQDLALVARASTRWEGEAAGSAHAVLGLFPHDHIRDGQKGLARDVQRAVTRGECLVAHAPTGLGKTAASVAPALQYALEHDKKVLFLTSKQSQHRIVVETLRAVVERRGGRFAAVDVISKRDMCPRPEKEEMPAFAFMDFCARACKTKQCSYFQAPADDAVQETRTGIHHVEELVDISLNHGCCPHKVAMGAAKEADVIVCDYNYLFSDLRERILDAFDVSLSDLIVIVDETHNLPDRVRGNFSLELTPYLLEEARTEARREKDLKTERWCRALGEVLDGLVAPLGDYEEVVLSKRELIDRVETHIETGSLEGAALGSFLDFTTGVQGVADARAKAGEPVTRSGPVGEFLEAWAKGGRAYGRILRRDPTGGWRLVHTLLDPGVITGPIFEDVHAAIAMSGTCYPPEMYRDVLGMPEGRTRVRAYASPFDQRNRPVVCVRGVTTKYTARTDAMYDRLARTVLQLHRAAPGNTAAFSISYDMLDKIAMRVAEQAPGLELLVEARGMAKSERDQFLDTLVGANDRGGALLLGVLGGSLSEGVDYRNNLLTTVSVVGLPLAPPSRSVDLLIEHFERKFPKKGKDYAYIFPAMERVLQAAGRGIRSETDRCPVVLLDERYGWRMYNRAFPDDFHPTEVEDPVRALDGFYQTVSS